MQRKESGDYYVGFLFLFFPSKNTPLKYFTILFFCAIIKKYNCLIAPKFCKSAHG